jgi:transposase-like protein
MSKSNPNPSLAPDPEVDAKPKRRRFSGAYKQRIIEECDAATEPGAIGEILRREGLYSSHLSEWRKTRRLEGVAGLAAKKRGRKPKSELAKENERLRRDLARAEERARRAELIVEAQKKLCAILGIPNDPPGSDESTP